MLSSGRIPVLLIFPQILTISNWQDFALDKRNAEEIRPLPDFA